MTDHRLLKLHSNIFLLETFSSPISKDNAIAYWYAYLDKIYMPPPLDELFQSMQEGEDIKGTIVTAGPREGDYLFSLTPQGARSLAVLKATLDKDRGYVLDEWVHRFTQEMSQGNVDSYALHRAGQAFADLVPLIIDGLNKNSFDIEAITALMHENDLLETQA